jgi:hypothetical protein
MRALAPCPWRNASSIDVIILTLKDQPYIGPSTAYLALQPAASRSPESVQEIRQLDQVIEPERASPSRDDHEHRRVDRIGPPHG